MLFNFTTLFCLAILPLVCLSSIADAQEPAQKKNARILMLTQSAGFKHGSVTRKEGQLSPAERAITDLGVSSGLFRVDCTQDAAKDFTKAALENYDIVFFYTSGDLPIPKDVLDYFLGDWLKRTGHGFVGAHAAADTYQNYQPYWDMIGGTFDRHPWNANATVTITVHEPEHPICKPWGSEFTIKDEIYQFKNWQPQKVRVLMSLNMAKTELKKPYHVPIAWCKEYGQGKVFHMSLGHNEAVWQDARYMQSMLGGIKWILGHEKGDATPNPELSTAQEAKAKTDFEAAQGK